MENNSRDIDMEKQIDAYVKGHLTEEEADRLWVELLKHPEYIDLLDTELHVKSIFEQQKQQTQVRFWDKSWKWAIAAAFIGVLIATLSLLQGSEGENGRLQAIPAINMAEHLASPDIVRAEISDLSEADSMLNIGFRAAISGQPDNALQVYQSVTSSYQDDSRAVSQAYYNIGILHYNTGRFGDAAGAFNRALEQTEENRILEEKARWFLAHTYTHLEQLEQARSAAEYVYSLDGIFRDQASGMLQKLDEVSAGESDNSDK